MDNSLHIPNEIRILLGDSEEWTDGIAVGDSTKFVGAYITTVRQMIHERKDRVVKLNTRRHLLTTFTYTAGFIGAGSAIGASVLYAINRSKGESSDINNLTSLILSIMTGSFVFIAGCGQLIADYKRYDKRALALADEKRLLEILCRSILSNQASNVDMSQLAIDTRYFMTIERDIFGGGSSSHSET